jgi:hypothetical protein
MAIYSQRNDIYFLKKIKNKNKNIYIYISLDL